MEIVELEHAAGGTDHRLGAVVVQPSGRHGIACHVDEVGKAEELVEAAGDGETALVVLLEVIGPLVEEHLYLAFIEGGEALFIFLPAVGHSGNAIGGHPCPFDHSLFHRLVLADRQIEVLAFGRIGMGRQGVEGAVAILQHPTGPIALRAERNQIGAAGIRHHALSGGDFVGKAAWHDDIDRRIGFFHRACEQLVLVVVLAGRHVPPLPVAVHLVADVPVMDLIRLRVTVCRALGAPERVGGAVDVFDQFAAGTRFAEAGVDAPIRFDADQLAHLDQLVDADVVGLNHPAHLRPHRILDRRTLVGIADGVLPVVGGNKVAAGQA